jgi:hypothetical protein
LAKKLFRHCPFFFFLLTDSVPLSLNVSHFRIRKCCLILTFGLGEFYDSQPTHASFLGSTGSNILQNKFVEIYILPRTVKFVPCTRDHHWSIVTNIAAEINENLKEKIQQD